MVLKRDLLPQIHGRRTLSSKAQRQPVSVSQRRDKKVWHMNTMEQYLAFNKEGNSTLA